MNRFIHFKNFIKYAIMYNFKLLNYNNIYFFLYQAGNIFKKTVIIFLNIYMKLFKRFNTNLSAYFMEQN